MKSYNVIVMVVLIVALVYFWIIPEGKKLITSWNQLQQIKAINKALDEGSIILVPKYNVPKYVPKWPWPVA